MDSSQTFQAVIEYLENVIETGDAIDYGAISKIAVSPVSLFQRIFLFVSGVTIAEYVRKRRLTLAGYELGNTGISVLDAAIKYGFHSHSAFTRAFKEHHGLTPSDAKRKTAELNPYFPINYAEMRYMGGKRIMADVKKIIYKETPERLMAGVHHKTSFDGAGKAWQAFFQSDAIRELNAPSLKKCCDDIDENAGIGMMYNFTDGNRFELIIGDFVDIGAQLPEGIYAKRIPAGTAAYIRIEGNSLPEILESAYLLITEAIEKTGREIDHDHFYWCEAYTLERYCKPLERGEKVTIDYILPVKATGGSAAKK